MPRIRLLTSAQGDGPVVGDPGDVLDVPSAVARIWADGQRAERVDARAAADEKSGAEAGS